MTISLSLQTANVATFYATGDQLPINAHFFEICDLQVTNDEAIENYEIDTSVLVQLNTMDVSQTLFAFGDTTISSIERAIVDEANSVADRFDDDADAQKIIQDLGVDETIGFVRARIETAEGAFWDEIRDRFLGR